MLCMGLWEEVFLAWATKCLQKYCKNWATHHTEELQTTEQLAVSYGSCYFLWFKRSEENLARMTGCEHVVTCCQATSTSHLVCFSFSYETFFSLVKINHPSISPQCGLPNIGVCLLLNYLYRCTR